MIPGLVEEVRYQRTGRFSGPYRHRFRGRVVMEANPDGSVTLRSLDGRTVWGWY